MSNSTLTPSRRGFLMGLTGAAAAAIAFQGTTLLAQDNKPSDSAAAAKAAGLPAPLDIIELEKDLFVIMGAGGNIAVHVSNDSAVVIDAGLPDRAKDVFPAVSKLVGNAKHKTLINTHWHFDHVGTNELLANDGYIIIGSTNTRKRLGETITIEDLGMTAQPLPESARPVVAFEKDLSLWGPTEIKLTKFAPAHTDTDAIVWFEKYGILHTGDLFFNNWFPVIDRSTGGSLDGMIASTKLLLSMVDDKTRIIPGHGAMAKKADLQSFLGLLELSHERLAPFGERKATIEEVLEKAPFADLDDKWGRGFLRSTVYTKLAYGQWRK